MVKQQHYVPQFYLRQFASDDGQIWVYDKVSDKAFRTAVRNVAGERYFYDSDEIEQALGDRQVVEKFLAKLEGEFGDKITRLLHRLRIGGFQRIHPETRTAIATFAAFQLIRTKEHRIQMMQTSELLKKFLLKHPGTEKMVGELDVQMSEKSVRESHARELLDLPFILHMSEILAAHIWVVARRHSSQGFYTSDEPITKHENVKIPLRGNNGIACQGIEVHVPLAHDYAITMYERKHFAEFERLDGRLLKLDSDQYMVYQRQFSVKQSSRFIYCREDDFALARQICSEEPHWRNPDRKRFTSNHADDLPQI